MQNKREIRKLKRKLKKSFIKIKLPTEAFVDSGLLADDVIQITVEYGKITLRSITDVNDVVCDKNCKECPLYDRLGDNCPNKNKEN